MAEPVATPVTTPEPVTVATPVLALLHVPPLAPVASERLMVPPIQAAVGPDIEPISGRGNTVRP